MHSPRLPLVAACVLLSLTSVASCRSPEPASPNEGLPGLQEAPQAPDLGRGAPRAREGGAYNVYVADPLRNVCAGSVPFFEFDSASTREGDQPSMETLAKCMLSGPLRGRGIKLVGHTDPRGTPGYNDKLGLERAERVKAYLVGRGVEAARIETSSVGAEAASAAPKDWPKDRRVEIQLVR